MSRKSDEHERLMDLVERVVRPGAPRRNSKPQPKEKQLRFDFEMLKSEDQPVVEDDPES